MLRRRHKSGPQRGGIIQAEDTATTWCCAFKEPSSSSILRVTAEQQSEWRWQEPEPHHKPWHQPSFIRQSARTLQDWSCFWKTISEGC
ncbi:hypothetical protein UPYG_G00083120 [Umbra pygmaea]|uniref:Uncharacterized protein n=1 Tax=Umbra pygmaea TaxID=75934 RepID=A0ABD0XYK6_UMBPY